MRPTWAKFWAEYPDYINFPDSARVKADLGGEVAAEWTGLNTCAMRMSRGLNYSGVPLPASRAGLLTVTGADKKWYALRVKDVRKWLPGQFGAADVDVRKKEGEAFDKATLSTVKGIIAFDVHFKDATGHLDAWDGRQFSSEYKAPEYWTRATRVTVWKLA